MHISRMKAARGMHTSIQATWMATGMGPLSLRSNRHWMDRIWVDLPVNAMVVKQLQRVFQVSDKRLGR